jgi:hypothetical protein
MRLLLWIGKWLAAAVLISTITVMTAWYSVNAYVESLLRYFNLDPAQISVSITDMLAQASKDWKAANSRIGQYPREDGFLGGEESGKRIADADQDAGDERNLEEDGAASEAASPDDAVAVWGRISEAQEAGGQGGEMVLTLEQFDQVKNEISNEDKIRIFAIVSKLPQESIQELSLYMENGVTQEELVSIQQMLENFLTKEQFDELMQIMKKY